MFIKDLGQQHKLIERQRSSCLPCA